MRRSKIESLDQVVQVAAEETVAAAAHAMRTQRVGFLVVVDSDGAPVGAVTDRDLALRVVAWQKEPESPVSEVMSAPLETLPADSTREQRIKRMAALGIRRLPLVEGDAVVDLVSMDDLCCELADELAGLAKAPPASSRASARRLGARSSTTTRRRPWPRFATTCGTPTG